MYIHHPEFRLWHRQERTDLAYSDGADTEARILKFIEAAEDLGTFSSELRRRIDDWASEYHLSAERHCLLRPIPIKPGDRVLELGCGCGALTRYLGEIGAQVTAVEGTLPRARAAASRCRDLPNVRVVVDDFLGFSDHQEFDWVFLIGVLEYAPLYASGADPIAQYLAAAKRNLASNGKLVVAIENKLGLKYFNGCTEDHVGRAFYGINGLYGSDTPVTFSRKELQAVVGDAGFRSQEFLYPFPDYKLPTVVLSQSAIGRDDDLAANLLARLQSRDYSGHSDRLFSEPLAMESLDGAGLVGDLANSFLLIASQGDTAPIFASKLAWIYSIGTRKSEFCCETIIESEIDEASAGETVKVKKRRIKTGGPTETVTARGRILSHRVGSQEFKYGKLFVRRINRALMCAKNVDDVVSAFIDWAVFLKEHSHCIDEKRSSQIEVWRLPGDMLDAIPYNVIETPEGLRAIDREWSLDEDVPLGWVLVRGLHETIFAGTMWDNSLSLCNTEWPVRLAVEIGLEFTAADLDAASQLEADLQSSACDSLVFNNRSFSIIRPALSLLADVRVAKAKAEVELAELRAALDEEKLQQREVLSERDRQIETVAALLGSRDEQLADVRAAKAEADVELDKLKAALDEGKLRERDVLATLSKHSSTISELAALQADFAGYLAAKERDNVALQSNLQSLRSELSLVSEKITERDRQIETVVALISSRDDQLTELRASLDSKEKIASELSAVVDALQRSTSWRITFPLRAVRRALNEPKRALETLRGPSAMIARSIYRKLPLSVKNRTRLKDHTFSQLSFLFRDTASYKVWQLQKRPEGGSLADGSSHHSTLATSLPENVAAQDDYAELTAFARQFKRAEIERLKPRPVPFLAWSDAEARSQAAQLSFTDNALPKVSIVIPVFNNVRLTVECLFTVQCATKNIAYEVIVVDDGSTDETPELIQRVPGLRYYKNEGNLGFVRTCNSGAKQAQGEFIVFLNNDAQVTDGWLEKLLSAIESRHDVGAVGPKIVYPNGRLQEAGTVINADASSTLIGVAEDAIAPAYSRSREVDYCSGACLLMRTALFQELGGFDLEFAPSYCEDVDLSLKIRERGLKILYVADAMIVHHLSATANSFHRRYKNWCVVRNQQKLAERWQKTLDKMNEVRLICFFLPQFHPIPENDRWWGRGFTEWTNVTSARPNFVGHQQPMLPADLGFYDLRSPGAMDAQAELAKRYGIYGFCYYYYWFAGKRLLDAPLESLLSSDEPAMPFCLCWANENWTRRWDGNEAEILLGQKHSPDDDLAVIKDLIRYMKHPNYIQVDGKPVLLVYRVSLFPDISETARIWRTACHESGIGDVMLLAVESHDAAGRDQDPRSFGFDGSVEFPPHNMGVVAPTPRLLNSEFFGTLYDYKAAVKRYIKKRWPAYPFYRGVMPRWDNTARRQNNSHVFVGSTPGAYQAWLDVMIEQTRAMHVGDSRIVFINSWNEWAEGAHLEPDKIFGHAYLEATRNALDAHSLLVR